MRNCWPFVGDGANVVLWGSADPQEAHEAFAIQKSKGQPKILQGNRIPFGDHPLKLERYRED